MNFVRHSNLEGRHAYLSASKYHWINYDEEKLAQTFRNFLAVERGTELHDLASRLIKLGVKLPKSNKTLNNFVNDAIGFKMESELSLLYSDNCFGTADAISFRNGKLRIHDLKTGEGPTHFEQLEIYAALFCLEYKFDPNKIDIELRIYQNDEMRILEPQAEDIQMIMDKIVTFDKILNSIRYEEK